MVKKILSWFGIGSPWSEREMLTGRVFDMIQQLMRDYPPVITIDPKTIKQIQSLKLVIVDASEFVYVNGNLEKRHADVYQLWYRKTLIWCSMTGTQNAEMYAEFKSKVDKIALQLKELT